VQGSTHEVLLGVIGYPVAHSKSPQMHMAALRAVGLPWHYGRLPVPPERFAATVRALPDSGYRGANVTIPHKVAALEVADERAPAAAATGAANTLFFLAEGGIRADNTDAGGLLDSLESSPAGLRVLVLGAGGSARAVAWVLREAGAAEVSIWNRTQQRADDLAAALGVRSVERPVDADLLVNATSVGLAPDTDEAEALRALHLDGRDPPPTVVDLVYGEHLTPVLAWARRGGARTVDGLEVLVRQGARSFKIWTGRDAPVDVMRAAARAPTA
jgi:shikimate dehydrogenase